MTRSAKNVAASRPVVRLMNGASAFVLSALCATTVANAQSTNTAKASDDIETVVVVGARAAQQSSIDRKKRAATPTDSIVADDVGAFPDRNLNEAISRIAGVSLGRNDYGEGQDISIRGNGPDLTRVEIDGLGVQSGSGSLAINGANGAGDGRGADMRELPSDLIKSVDVVKGVTADMTEGSLGGGIQIKTRTGLDFKKPYFSMRVGGSRNSLGERVTPDLNIVASRKFFDNRLGVIFSLTSTQLQNNGHNMQTVTSGNAGYARSIDWDNSPEKTFTFNPATVQGDAINTPNLVSPGVVATQPFNSNTPLQIVTKSANAKTKAECLAAFPLLTATELNTISAGTNNANRVAAQNQRIYEQITCLNQWNDYHPSLIRSFLNTQNEERLAADIRFDYRINENLTVYAKYAIANRFVDDQVRNRTLGGVNVNTSGTFTDSLVNNTAYAFGTPNVRTAVPGSGYYIYNTGFVTAPSTIDILPGTATNNVVFPVMGQAVNVDPSSVKVDANHHVTAMTISDGVTNIDQIDNEIDVKTRYINFGGEYKKDRLRVEFLAGLAESDYSRFDARTNRQYSYGQATLEVQPSGLWGYTLPATYNEDDPNNYVQMRPATAAIAAVAATINNPATPAYTIAQQPWTSASFGIQWSPRLQENSEKTFKTDVTYRLKDAVPFFSQFKTGISYREQDISAWQGGGLTVKPAVGTFGTATYVPPVVLPTNNLRGTFRACDDTKYGTTGTAAPAGALSCNYGYVPSTNLSNVLYGVETFTPDQLRAIIANSIEPADSVFFNGYPEKSGNMTSWNGINIDKLLTYMQGDVNFNFDCMKSCKASDGNVYQQPVLYSNEKVTAAYYQFDFEQPLPFFNMEVMGNFGLRVVETEVTGTGLMTFTSITKNASFDPANPLAAGGVNTASFSQNAQVYAKDRDYLPSYNLALWLVPDKLVTRYSWGKTVARPRVDRLLPGGTCTFDERRLDQEDTDGSEADNTCTGRVGNPGLKPYTAKSQNWTVEWYPNKDTTVSIARLQLDVLVGAPVASTRSNVRIFAGSGQVDPNTGRSVDDLEFTYPTWDNGPGYKRTGWEYSSKTAFTFLPWYFRYTGLDANYTKLESSGNAAIFDPNSGTAMRPINEPLYMANVSLWYDDGKTTARVSYQARGEVFTCITSCGSNAVNNYPGPWGFDARPVPYNPGQPRFADESKFVDAKISHKVSPNVEIYLEGRNITRSATSISGGDYNNFSNADNIYQLSYGGRRVMFGVIYRAQ